MLPVFPHNCGHKRFPSGPQVDGLPGLILCSGVVVAAGREPFRSANYNAQKSAPEAVPSSNRASLRRLKSFNRKFGSFCCDSVIVLV